MKRLVILGASGHGRVAADIAGKNGYDSIAFLDDTKKTCGRYPVMGESARFSEYDCDFFVAIGNPQARRRMQEMLLTAGKQVTTLIHPSAVIGEDVTLGTGTLVAAGAVINPGAVIGDGCIINTCASVDHDCVLEDFVHVAVGAHVAGTVSIGAGTWIGAGATVSNNLQICGGCMIGAGAVVIKSITESGTYVGVPAEKIK